MIQFSIIIPTYNASKFLDKCLNSVFSLNRNDYEVIVIDDGSVDQTKDICNQYCLNHQFRYHYQDNQGVSTARNVGIQLSKGKYLLFVDADDVVEKGLSNLFDIVDDQYDLYIGSYYDFGVKKKNVYQHLKECLDKDEFLKDYKKWAFHYLNSPFAKIYKKDLIIGNNISFRKDLYIGEDLTFNMDYILSCNSIYCSDEMIYGYQVHLESTMKRFRENLNTIEHALTRSIFDKVKGMDVEYPKIMYFVDTFNFVKNYYLLNQSLSSLEKKRYVMKTIELFSEFQSDLRLDSYHLSFSNRLLFYSIKEKSYFLLRLYSPISKIDKGLKLIFK